MALSIGLRVVCACLRLSQPRERLLADSTAPAAGFGVAHYGSDWERYPPRDHEPDIGDAERGRCRTHGIGTGEAKHGGRRQDERDSDQAASVGPKRAK